LALWTDTEKLEQVVAHRKICLAFYLMNQTIEVFGAIELDRTVADLADNVVVMPNRSRQIT
jgi:hypothetical protein